MSKLEWQDHMREVLREVLLDPEPLREYARAHKATCPECAKRRATLRANRNSRERSDAMRSLGLVKTPYGWE